VFEFPMDKLGAAILAALCGIMITASATLAVVVTEALTGLHIGPAIVGAAIGTFAFRWYYRNMRRGIQLSSDDEG
jgi:hypothetical protein